MKPSLPIFLFLLVTGVTSLLAAWVPNSCAKVGIITAFDNTFLQVKERLEITEQRMIGGRTFVQGKLDTTPVTLVRSPMGKINNAVTTQILISSFEVETILSLSPAGSLNDDLHIGDFIIATTVYQHDFGTWKPYGFIWRQVPVPQTTIHNDYNSYPAQALERIPEQALEGYKFVKGIVVSGDQFVADQNKRQWLKKKFQANAVDMGAAAIAQTCYSNNVPVLILRVITDYADNIARVTFSDSVSSYTANSTLLQFILSLPEVLDQS